MNKINRALFWLVAYIFAVFGLEVLKIYFGISFSPSIYYIFIAIIILSVIAFPAFTETPRIGLISLWSFGYLVCRFSFYPLSAPYKGLVLFNIFLENFILWLAVILSCHMVGLIQGYKLLQDKLIEPSSNRLVKVIKNSLEDIEAEFYRCRRFSHSLSILAIEPTPASLKYQAQVTKKSQNKLLYRFITMNLSDSISQQIRRFDMILIREWDGRFFILCPENTVEGTISLARRINDNAQKNLGLSLLYGYGVFPQDALTFEELLKHAEKNLNIARANFNQNTNMTSGMLSDVSAPIQEDTALAENEDFVHERLDGL